MIGEHTARKILRQFFREYAWVHITLGIIGNCTFFVGSVLFFRESTQHEGTWLFVIGSLLMPVGSIGNALIRYAERKHNRKPE